VLNFNSLITDKRLYHFEGLGPLLVEAFSLRENLSAPWELHLSTLSEKVGLDLNAMLNKEVTLHTTLADGSRWSRKGVVVVAESDQADGSLARYRLEVQPWLYYLAHTRRAKSGKRRACPPSLTASSRPTPPRCPAWPGRGLMTSLITWHKARSPRLMVCAATPCSTARLTWPSCTACWLRKA
jgi:hypothetical protein